MFTEVPEVDISDPGAVVEACKQFGIFRLVHHGVPSELIRTIEDEVVTFFSQPQPHKDKAGPPDPCGYGTSNIGSNGDQGSLEYLILNTNSHHHKTLLLFQQNSHHFRSVMVDFVRTMKNLSCQVLEAMAEGLGIQPKNVFSKLIRDERSDCLFRFNSYLPCPEHDGGGNLIGFGEHTDPQIISILRSNNSSGFQICLRDGTWVSIPPDPSSFFVIVGDLLQVLTNGIFRSVKHRVVTGSMVSRLSMIYFGGPPLNQKIAPLSSLISEEEESLYKELTWQEYKNAAYKSRLSDNRLSLFDKVARS